MVGKIKGGGSEQREHGWTLRRRKNWAWVCSPRLLFLGALTFSSHNHGLQCNGKEEISSGPSSAARMPKMAFPRRMTSANPKKTQK